MSDRNEWRNYTAGQWRQLAHNQADELERLTTERDAMNDSLVGQVIIPAEMLSGLQAKVDALTAQNKTQYDRMGEQIQVNADLLKRVDALKWELRSLVSTVEYEEIIAALAAAEDKDHE